MKKLIAACSIAILGLLSLPVQANIVTTLHLDFSSGAQYDGTVTFMDDYLGLIDTDGTLSGGSYGSQHFGWTWWAGTGQPNPQDYDGDAATYEDILMSGDVVGSFVNFISFSWVHGNVGDVPVLNLDPLSNPSNNYWKSVFGEGRDTIVSGTFGNTVPEPGSLALLGLAIACIGLTKRKVKQV